MLSTGVYLWLFGSLRSFLLRAEGGTGRLTGVAFGAGVCWAVLQMVFQSIQLALALGAQGELDPATGRRRRGRHLQLYVLTAVWQVAVTTVRVMRLRRPPVEVPSRAPRAPK